MNLLELLFQILANIFTKLDPETATQINEDLEITEFDGAYF